MQGITCRLLASLLTMALTTALFGAAQGQAASPDERARETEAKMTDDERFSLIISLLGPATLVQRDPRIPEDVKNLSAGYTPGIPRQVTITADPRLLALFDGKNGLGQWRITEGIYRVALGRSAGDLVLTVEAPLAARVFGK
jgi:hypothetical protein